MDISAVASAASHMDLAHVQQAVTTSVMKNAVSADSAAMMALLNDLAEAMEGMEAAMASVVGSGIDVSV
ncbi:hypothetical protein LJC32_05385 [Oscillospiraceae bacterium OttesenSCG-928-F05]|nr:hypothetical protein [Oscillospiraceae bacterium OttesenSCG-928-F05]